MYQVQVLLFGQRMAPQVFTKVLAPIIVYLRKQGVEIFVYLDIILIVENSPRKVECAVWTALQALTQAGYIIYLNKSDLPTVQDLVYIGGRFKNIGKRYWFPTSCHFAWRAPTN